MPVPPQVGNPTIPPPMTPEPPATQQTAAPHYLTWDQVKQKPQFQALPDGEKQAAAQEYFNTVVAPHVPTQDLPTVQQQFSDYTGFSVGNAAPKNQGEGSQFVADVKSGVHSTLATGAGLVGLVGDAVGSKKLRDWGVKEFQAENKIAQAEGPRVNDIKDIHSVHDFVDWLSGGLGSMAPMVASAIAGGGVGGLLARGAVKLAAKKMEGHVIKEMTAKGIDEEVAKQSAASIADKMASNPKLIAKFVSRGQAAGTFATMAGQSTGGIYGDLGTKGIHGAKAIAGSLAGGALAGAALTVTPLSVASHFGFGKVLQKRIVDKMAEAGIKRRIAASAVAHAALGGSAMGLSTFITEATKSLVQDKAMPADIGHQVINSIAQGAAAGVLGGAAAGTAHPAEDLAAKVNQQAEANPQPQAQPETQQQPLAALPAPKPYASEIPVAPEPQTAAPLADRYGVPMPQRPETFTGQRALPAPEMQPSLAAPQVVAHSVTPEGTARPVTQAEQAATMAAQAKVRAHAVGLGLHEINLGKASTASDAGAKEVAPSQPEKVVNLTPKPRKAEPAPKPVRQRGPEKASNILVHRIKQMGGIDKAEMRDFGEAKANKTGTVGLFRQNGLPLDELATRLYHEGFPINPDSVDGGVQDLRDLIQKSLSGEKVLNHEGQMAEADRAQAEQHRAQVEQEAKQLGIETKGKKLNHLEAKVAEKRKAEVDSQLGSISDSDMAKMAQLQNDAADAMSSQEVKDNLERIAIQHKDSPAREWYDAATKYLKGVINERHASRQDGGAGSEARRAVNDVGQPQASSSSEKLALTPQSRSQAQLEARQAEVNAKLSQGNVKGPERGSLFDKTREIANSQQDMFSGNQDHPSNAEVAPKPQPISAESFKSLAKEAPELFKPISKDERVRVNKEAGPYISRQKADDILQSWYDHVDEQAKNHRSENSDRTVFSLFDNTGKWAQPWEEAGYNVIPIDIQRDPGHDIADFTAEKLMEDYGDSLHNVYAVLVACPCTDFASSGARHFEAKDASGQTADSVHLVHQAIRTIEFLRPQVWALENPVGRIEKLTNLPPWRMSFQPHNFGDPYTKKTLLWGKFNADLPTANVDPVEGSKMHSKYGGSSQATKNARSETPEGFSYAFFMANNYIDMPTEQKLPAEFPEVAGEVRKALDAGLSEKKIRDTIEWDYGNEEYDAAAKALKQAIADNIKADEKPSKDNSNVDPMIAIRAKFKSGEPLTEEETKILQGPDNNSDVPFSKSKSVPGGMSVEDATAAVSKDAKLAKALKSGKLKIVKSVKDLPANAKKLFSTGGVKVEDLWNGIANSHKVFQNDATDAKSMADIAANTDPAIKVQKFDPKVSGHDLWEEYRLQTADGNSAYVRVNKDKTVELNVASLKAGRSLGSKIYHIVGTFAHNNGLKFIGDREGLSTDAMYRRTENMLSLALKYGTTKFLEPHAKQDIKWGGSDSQNLRELIRRHYANVYGRVTALRGIRYDPSTGDFRRDDGSRVSDADFKALADTPGAKEARAGRATLKRAALTHTLVSAERSGTGHELLAALAGELRTFGRLRGLSDILYSKRSEGSSVDSHVQGAYSGGTAYIIADGNSPDTVVGTAWHELTHAAMDRAGSASKFLGAQKHARLMAELQRIYKAAQRGDKALSSFFKEAFKSIPADTLDANKLDELAAYAVEHYNNEPRSVPAQIAKWAKDFIAAIKAAVYRHTGILLGKLRPEDINALAKGYADFAASHDSKGLSENTGKLGTMYSVKRPGEGQDPLAELRAYHGKPEKMTFREKVQSLFDDRWQTRLIQYSADRFRSLMDLDKEKGYIDERGRIKDYERSVYVAARLSTSGDTLLSTAMMKGALRWKDLAGGAMIPEAGEGTKGFLDILNMVGGDNIHDWESYLVAKRAKRLKGEKNPDGSPREKVLSDAAIEAGLKLGRDNPRFEEAAKEWAKFNKGMLDFAEKAGLINPETRKLWENDDYVPFYRVMNAKEYGPRSKTTLFGQEFSKTLKGSKAPINDIVENMVRNTSHLIDASIKNHAAAKAVKIMEEMRLAHKKVAPRIQAMSEAETIDRLKNLGIDPNDLTNAEFQHFRKEFAGDIPMDSHTLRVMVDGKPQHYFVNDPLLTDSLSSVNSPMFGQWIKFFTIPKRLLTSMVTATPEFQIANFLRDTLQNYVMSRTKGVPPVVAGLKGAVKVFKQDDDYWRMMANGGAFHSGYINASDPGSTASIIKKEMRSKGFRNTVLDSPRKLMDKWLEVSSAMENANRMSIYKAIIDQGGSELKAAYEARDIMDFTSMGSGSLFRFFATTVPFFNARLQGLYRLGRGMHESPQSFLLKGSMITAASLALLSMNQENDKYRELENWDKDTYWHFFINGEHYRIPKPFEVGFLFGTLPERIQGIAYDKSGKAEKNFYQDLGWNFMQVFSFNPIPQAVKPVAEAYFNKDLFTDRKIVPDYLGKLPAAQQERPYTSATMVELGNATGLSPLQLQHLVRAYTGSMGSYLLGAADWVTRGLYGYPDMPSMRLDQYPMLKRFYEQNPRPNTQYQEDFYNLMQAAQSAYASVQQYQDNGMPQKAREAMVKERGNLAMKPLLTRLDKAVQSDYRRINAIYLSKTLTSDQKRAQLDAIQERQNVLYEKAVRMAQKLRKEYEPK